MQSMTANGLAVPGSAHAPSAPASYYQGDLPFTLPRLHLQAPAVIQGRCLLTYRFIISLLALAVT